MLFFVAGHLADEKALPDANAVHDVSPLTMAITEWLQLGFVFFATWIMSRIEDRSVFDYGLSRTPRRLRWMFIGVLLGLTFQSLLIVILWSTHHLVFAGVLLRPLSAVGYGLAWAIAFLGVGFFEEFLFRGYLQFSLTQCLAGLVRYLSPTSRHAEAIGFWSAAVLISFGFGLSHGLNPGESPIGILCAGCAGLMFAFSLWRTGSLWWAIGLHAAWDWAQSFLFGVAGQRQHQRAPSALYASGRAALGERRRYGARRQHLRTSRDGRHRAHCGLHASSHAHIFPGPLDGRGNASHARGKLS